jgi:hypothetical protein
VFSGLLPDHRELSDYKTDEWVPLPTPGQWTEQIDGCLSALQGTQNDP